MRELDDDKIVAVDLFCGAGGLTCGLENAGISVKLGVDIDPDCAHPIEINTKARFLQADVSILDSGEISSALKNGGITLVAGCAPCQPFSTYSRSAKQKHGENAGNRRSEDWRLAEHFGNIIRCVQPDLVAMENVPPLAQQEVFKVFLDQLEGYWVDWRIVECHTIGLPQTRKRLVLLASKLGPISIPEFDYPRMTVESVIGGLPKISAGGQDLNDRLHKASRLSSTNMARIRCSLPGGTWRDWPEHLRAACHTKESGATYPSVYGRMEWGAPAPTITTQCFGYGNGRFGHPEQDRAISLREAAMLQGFPRSYSFIPDTEAVSFAKIGRLIGNAVPVTLGRVIGELLQKHVALHKAKPPTEEFLDATETAKSFLCATL
ncbi:MULTISPECIES: DNA cytosine methyltransferase [Pseudomonas syringae group]|uniref:DNA (cytosine-5-)-methyltransferase n=2 Tax=Pseudomonas syringae group TaxID=136849 RepID=A0A0P9NEB9_PSESX|nr:MULTISPECIES: DNA cytosine methyltransferase [Pseudomonas syringae group]KPW95572.1 Cytosine-specific methyltransferase [Pseudomonas syringae pv. castaneae]KWS92074.1 DNA cytosine methyltransferase [Pseudomonas syringae pv. castaneae]RMS84700.1 Cytosine-specific methyltransferase [Pseudomonas savastanoi]